MKKLLLIFLASTLLFCKPSLAQTDFPIGTGTTGNTSTTYPAPLQDYYEGSRMQFLYRASELTAAGMVAGPITAVKFNVTTLNAAGIIEQMAISIGGTTDTTLGSATWVAGTTSVWGPFDYQTTTGTNLFPFSTPYIWNGTDNIVIEICNGDPNNPTTTTYTTNPTVNFTTGLTFNGSHSYRSDGLGNLCGTATTTNTGTQTTRPNVIFDTTSCMPPTGIVFSNIATDSVSVTWTPPSSTPSQYYWEIRTSGTPGSSGSGLVDSGYVSTNDLNINGLLPATTYYFYIRSVCGTTRSSWSSAPSFATACVAVTSITENFDATTIPSLPTCWSKIMRGSTISTTASLITINATTNVYSAPNAVSMYNSGSTATDDIMLVSPALSNLGAGTYRLTFYAKNSNATQDLEIGTLDDNTTTANFSVLQTVDIGTTYQKYTVDFSSYTGTDQYIGIRRLSTSTYTYVYLDNIVWELIPSCVNPTGGIVSNITSSSVQLDWTAPSTGTPTGYDVYYNISNVPPTSTTTPTVAGITGTTAPLNGLTPATKYYFYIRTVCGTSGTSAWTDKDSFTTACVAVTILNENFDGVSIPALPVCWSKILRGTTLSTSATVTTIAANSNSAPNAVSMYNAGSTATDDIMLVSPALSNVGAGTYRLTFYARNSTATQDLEIGTLDDNTTTANFSVLQTVDIGTTYQKYTVDFSSYTGTDQYIAFRRLSTSTFTYVYLDNIVWELIPSCVNPTGGIVSNITSSSVQLDWTAPSTGTPTGYDVYYNISNVPPTVTTTPTVTGVTGTTTTLNGLTPSTKYYFYIRTVCGTSGTSVWTDKDSFTTACVAVTTLNENFDGVTIPVLPVCWSKILRGTTLSTFANVTTTAANANSAPNAVSMYNSGSTATDDIILVSPALSNVGAGTYRLTFFAKNSNALNDIEVGTLDGNTSTAVFSPLETVDVTTTYQKFTVSFSTYTGTDQYIGIRRLNASTFSYVYVDNVVWELIPGCVEPTGVIASNITTSGAQLDWTAPTTGTPISYDIFYSTVNTAPTGTTTPTVSAVTGTSYTVNGLNPSTDYYVWVRTNCGTSGFSAWTPSYLFTTACGIITAPTVAAQTFSGTIPPLCWAIAKGLLASPTTITPATTSNWVSDDFGNVTTPINKSAKINIYTTNRQDWLMTPSYDLGTSGNFQLEFDLALTAYAATTSATLGADDKFYVVISTDNGVTWDSVNTLRRWDATTPISNVGEHITIPLATYTGIVMFGFYGESTLSNADNDLFVDNVELKPMIIFPVEFVSFKGSRKEDINQLSWTTATELNNKGFEVQRSLDGEHFSTLRFVATLAPNGTSSTLLNYQFADDRSPNVSAYYRLKQVNTDGRSKYSNVVLIKGNVSNITLSGVYPNPVKRDVNITIQSPSNDNLTLIITDLAGKVVNKRIVKVLAGDNKFNFNVETLSAGTYIMKAICANGCEAAVQKFVKQ